MKEVSTNIPEMRVKYFKILTKFWRRETVEILSEKFGESKHKRKQIHELILRNIENIF